MLARLEGVGWLTSDWEDVDASAAGRPRRRYYRLTGEGIHTARAALAARQAAIDARRRAPVQGAARPATSMT
ncbi:MAG TPA: helix-turn-helix transcriptional regulator [Tetrasphaera sp.]|nr:helix-turn-helix transcriptional regulator [Tetrasphaera sp.]